MKFFTTIAASLVLGSQVLAVPVDNSTVTTAVGVSVDTTTVVTTVCGIIAGLESTVSSELNTILSLSASNVTDIAVPAIKNALANIAIILKSTTSELVPALAGEVTTLTTTDVQAILAALGEVESTVNDIKSTLTTTVSHLADDILALVRPDIAAVLGLAMPLVTPLTTFVFQVVSLVPGGDAVISDVTSAASGLLNLVGTLLDPVAGLLGSLL